MRRLIRFLRMILSWLVSGIEETVPLERHLAYDRQERAQKVKRMMDGATDVGEAAEMMVQGLAEERIRAANLRQEIIGHLNVAQAAAARSDTITEETEQAAAAALADELAEAEADVEKFERDVDDALRDKEEAKQMVLVQARELEQLARRDASLVGRVRITQMKDESTRLREAMLQLIPEDRDDIRARAVDRAKRREARVKSRTELVDALWQQKRRGLIDRRTQVSARGAQILRQLQQEVGYVPSIPAPPPIVAETADELKRKLAAQ